MCDEDLVEALEDGRRSFDCGKEESENPYSEETQNEMFLAWADGWWDSFLVKCGF